MTNHHSPAISIRFANEFENELYRLSKKYRRIRADVEPIIIELQKGNFLGDRLQRFGGDYFIYKVRVKNSNIQKGKSGGYRLIYCVESPLPSKRDLISNSPTTSNRTLNSPNK